MVERPPYRWAAVGFLAALTIPLVIVFSAYWALLLLAAEVFRPVLEPVWRRLHGLVADARALLAPLKRIPGALIGLPLLFAGLGLGIYAPETVQWLADGVAAAVRGLALATPYVIFLTLTPAIAGTLSTGRAGKFALYVNGAYLVLTVAAGLLAILFVVPVFGIRLSGAGATGPQSTGTDLTQLAFTAPAFQAIFLAVGLSLMIHGFRLQGLFEATRFLGGKLIDLVGDLLKILLPLVLFSLGVFIPTRVAEGVDRAQAAGAVGGTGWVGRLDPTTAYFIGVLSLVFLLALWVGALSVGVMRYTRFPLERFFRDYFFDVYAYAWATASSSATIPLNLELTGSALKVRRNVREFIVPLGATVHLDGTIMSGMLMAVIAAQLVGYTPTVLDLLFILPPLIIVTVGAPGIPGGLAIVGGPVIANLLPLPPGTQEAFTAIFVGFNLGLSDQFRSGVNSIGNGILSRLMEHWYPTKFAKRASTRLRVLKAAPT